MNEIWKDIPGYEGLYRISNYGSIIGNKGLRKNNPHKRGYLQICLHKNKIRKYFFIHRLVALSFLKNKDNLPQVNHKNGIKTDNRAENLEWCTASENQKHAYKIGLSKPRGYTCNVGGLNYRAKKVSQFSHEGTLIKEWEACSIAGRDLGINSDKISRCCRGERNTYKGFIWKYE